MISSQSVSVWANTEAIVGGRNCSRSKVGIRTDTAGTCSSIRLSRGLAPAGCQTGPAQSAGGQAYACRPAGQRPRRLARLKAWGFGGACQGADGVMRIDGTVLEPERRALDEPPETQSQGESRAHGCQRPAGSGEYSGRQQEIDGGRVIEVYPVGQVL